MPEMPEENFSCVLPWREHNDVQLLIDGDEFFPRIFQAIDQASSAVDIELYLCESGELANQFIDALIRAKTRGAYVRVLLDHVGSINLKAADRARLRQAGVDLRFFNRLRRHKRLRNLSRDHRKILIIDCQKAFTGGAGITDSFSQQIKGHKAWRECMVEMQGEVVHDWQLLFERTWQHYNDVHKSEIRQRLKAVLETTPNNPIANRSLPQARVVASRGIGNKPIIGSLLAELAKANSKAWIATAYFYPSRKLVKALAKASQRGVDVRLLLPGPHTDHPGVRYAGRSWYKKLLEANIRIYEYQPRFLHMKVAVVDQWITIGSCNFDRWNLRWNLEANLEIIDPAFTTATNNMLHRDLLNAKEIELERWQKRSYLDRVKERFWKWIGLFLGRFQND